MHLKLADSVFIHPKLSGFIRDIGGTTRSEYPHTEWSCKFPITCAPARVGHVSSVDRIACGRITLVLWKQRTENEMGVSGHQNSGGTGRLTAPTQPSASHSHHSETWLWCRLDYIFTYLQIKSNLKNTNILDEILDFYLLYYLCRF